MDRLRILLTAAVIIQIGQQAALKTAVCIVGDRRQNAYVPTLFLRLSYRISSHIRLHSCRAQHRQKHSKRKEKAFHTSQNSRSNK